MTTIYMAALADPTDDGILASLINWVIGALMVGAAGLSAWFAFKAWNKNDGEGGLTILRDHAISLLAIEAFLGGVLLIANRGTSIIPGLG